MKKIATIRIIWYKNRLFFYLLAALFIVGLFPFFILDKCSFFILLKQWHHPVADSMAPYLTLLGDGFVYLAFLVVLALLRVSCRKIMIMGGSFLAMSVVVQLLKRVFFSHMLRPMGLLLADASLHLVDGVPLLTDLSFPSGHSATIFTLVSVIQLLCNNKKNIYSLALVGAALMVAYSRIYLCQHFYIDVYVGACIGTLATVASYWVALQFNGLDWLDRSIYFLLYTNGNRCTIKK